MIKNIGLSVRKAFALATTITGFLAFSATPAAAAVLLVDDNGQLTGATGVDVGGTLFDVEFVAGSCITVFGGCDEPSDFDFSDGVTAELAAQALLDQVLIDSPAGNFDSEQGTIFNCGVFTGVFGASCSVVIPFDFNTTFGFLSSFVALNRAGELQDAIDPAIGGISPADNFGFNGGVFASFTAQGVSEVPLPAAAWMFLAGLGGLTAARRKGRDNS